MLTITVTDDLDLSQYDPEQLVTARLVQKPYEDEEVRTIAGNVSSLKSAEEELRSKLTEEQRDRRDEHLAETAQHQASAVEFTIKDYFKSVNNINANLSKLLGDNHPAMKLAGSYTPPKALREAMKRSADGFAPKYTVPTGYKLVWPTPAPTEGLTQPEELEPENQPFEADPTEPDEESENLLEAISEDSRQVQVLETILDAAVTAKNTQEKHLELVEQQVGAADKRTRTSYVLTGISLGIAGLSLIFATVNLFKPSPVELPDGPVPVQIVEQQTD